MTLRATPSQVLVVGFASVILTGAVLLTMPSAVQPGQEISFLTSLFTATSAVCVTGLVVVDTGTHWTTLGHVVILALIQVGGLGFMTMATFFAMLLGRRIGLRQRLIIQEALNQTNVAGIVRLAKYVLLFTFTTEFVFAMLLAIRWSSDLGWQKGIWYGLFHSVSAFNNAGFDLFGDFKSLTGYTEDITVNLCITTLIILGGIGFSVIVDLVQHNKNFRRLSLHTKMTLSVTGLLLIAGTLIIYFLEMDNTLKPLSPVGKTLAAYFQAVTPRTAGYNTLDTGALRSATQFFIVILMFIGASPGSTGGGVKTTTVGALAIAVWSMAKGKENAEIFHRRIGQEQIYKSITIVILAMGLVTVVSLLLSITENADFLTVLFETTSAFGTVGLTMGLTPKLTVAGRLLIIMTMFLGRVGPLTAAFALAQKRGKASLIYPEEKIMVG
ncbi:TrkH family potassium uptake protein [Pelotomaculum isophthalicicum JI]|uniref:TrkH family potassium uptake protein n=1 Tax=Pelotomaculum isophthalicicum JI TaxID=947010 RepID=A0A9X4H2K7_9FIRM|nr:TrkH family potassium uptake protein [Pelotomaculum isophthalicicum]MDF9408940.1 TrkH family potassium uptake protein [Pelotomaculum isophthalicicum JI]